MLHGTASGYGHLFAKRRRTRAVMLMAVVEVLSLAVAAVSLDLASDLAWFIFFGSLLLWRRQVSITDAYLRAKAVAAEPDGVRQQTQWERKIRRIPPPLLDASYAVLGLNENATESEIRTAFRALVKRYHPDRSRYSGAVNAEKLRQVQDAYAALRNTRRCGPR